MELELNVRTPRGMRNIIQWCTDYGTAVICIPELRRHVINLDETRSLFAVFTKTARGNHDFFTIRPDGSGVWAFDGTYFQNARTRLADAYRAGFRYLHFEQPNE